MGLEASLLTLPGPFAVRWSQDAQTFQDLQCVVDAGEGGNGGTAPYGQGDPQAVALALVIGGAGDVDGGGVGGGLDVDGDAEHGDGPFGEVGCRFRLRQL